MNGNKRQRIKAACQELEQALNNFEDETEVQEQVKKEAHRIREIKKRLDEIKQQLEEFSN